MKKTLLCAVFLPLVLNAQDYSGRVGINTQKPQATLDISKKELNTLPSGHTQGVLFPEFSTAERSTFTNPKKGTMIYNTDKECIEIYRGISGGVHQWSCLPDVGSNKIQTIAVTSQGFDGKYIGGVAFNNSQKAKFKLENNSFSNINSSFADAVSIKNGSASISISDCRWKLLPSGSERSCVGSSTVNLVSGQSALLSYTLKGTPETGILEASFSKLGAQADQQIQVGLGSATITNPQIEYILSLTYNGNNIQGKINNGADKLVVKIPYANGSGSYEAVTSTVTTAAGENNDTNTLTLDIPAGNFGVSGYLDATITVGGNDREYLVKKLAPGKEYDIATIPYTLNGQQYSVILRGMGGVPDKLFAQGKDYVYIPKRITVTKSNGSVYDKTWLVLPLWSTSAKVSSSQFAPFSGYYKINPTPLTFDAGGASAECPNGYRVAGSGDYDELSTIFKDYGTTGLPSSPNGYDYEYQSSYRVDNCGWWNFNGHMEWRCSPSYYETTKMNYGVSSGGRTFYYFSRFGGSSSKKDITYARRCIKN
ncbi:hypothetical protein PG291_08960 [Riemerella anatipestifer]|nr:hypothetical protein [Riemerella anatipestifer]